MFFFFKEEISHMEKSLHMKLYKLKDSELMERSMHSYKLNEQNDIIELNLDGCDKRNIEDCLKKLKSRQKIRRLSLSKNRLRDIDFLETFTHLERLNISHNNITDISVLRGLNNLEEIDMSINLIDDFSPLYHKYKKAKNQEIA
jgi:Leucine-rich repeat (LRR) protein